MNFNLSDVQRSSMEQARTLGRGLPEDAVAADVVRAAARAGLIGSSADLLSAVVVVEALAHESAAAGIALAVHASVALGVSGDERFSALLSGEIVGAIAMSADEVPAEHDRRLTGRASWVGPLTTRGLAIVGARTGETTLVYAVSLDAAGAASQPVAAAALRGFVCGHVGFDGTPCIPVGATVPFMARVRVLLAAAGLGMGRRALSEALHAAQGYSRTGAGGEQTVQGLLADAATELDAATVLTWSASSAPVLSLADASMAKLAATEATQRAVARATQVVGVDSFRRGHVVERLAQDVRALELFAGRTEALRQAMADEILPRV